MLPAAEREHGLVRVVIEAGFAAGVINAGVFPGVNLGGVARPHGEAVVVTSDDAQRAASHEMNMPCCNDMAKAEPSAVSVLLAADRQPIREVPR